MYEKNIVYDGFRHIWKQKSVAIQVKVLEI